MIDKQFASVNNVPPEPWAGQDTRDRGMRCLIAPHFLALSYTARRRRERPLAHFRPEATAGGPTAHQLREPLLKYTANPLGRPKSDRLLSELKDQCMSVGALCGLGDPLSRGVRTINEPIPPAHLHNAVWMVLSL